MRRVMEWLRWVLLAGAVAIVIVFLVAQRQTADVTYGKAPPGETIAEGSAGELTHTTLPTVDQMTAMLKASKVVRLPGAIAVWDQAEVDKASAGADVRILVAPPGLTKDQTAELNQVDNADVRVIGTSVSGDIYEVTSSTLAEWRTQFGRDDITSLLVTIINATVHDKDHTADVPDSVVGATWRTPTNAEMGTVAARLKTQGWYAGPGATLTAYPKEVAHHAFGSDDALFVAMPAPPVGQPAPDYGPALASLFPDRPIVVMYGYWIAYYGPHAADFADLAGATFYGRFADRLSAHAYPQDNVLGAYLGSVATIRYAGLFDRPLPYHPVDPLRVALPLLPWLFAVCVAAFLALSIRSLLRPAHAAAIRLGPSRHASSPARLAGLTALAVEVSGFPAATGNPALARAIGKLTAAREALDDRQPDRAVRALLNDAETELDAVGRSVEFDGYRPETYLRGRLA